MEHYQGQYSDASGIEDFQIANDGVTLTCRLRGVEFSGQDFDDLEPAPGDRGRSAEPFLVRARLSDRLLVSLHNADFRVGGRDRGRSRSKWISLGEGDPLRLALTVEGEAVRISGPARMVRRRNVGFAGGCRKRLLRCCLFCKFSEYPIGGNGMFGGLLCFRNLKSEIVAVRSKLEFAAVDRRAEKWVQETELCGGSSAPEQATKAPETTGALKASPARREEKMLPITEILGWFCRTVAAGEPDRRCHADEPVGPAHAEPFRLWLASHPADDAQLRA